MSTPKMYKLLARHDGVEEWSVVPNAPLLEEEKLDELYDELMRYCVPVGGEYKGNLIWVTQIAPGKRGFITVEAVDSE